MKNKKRNSDSIYKNLKVGKLNFKDCFVEILYFKKCLFKRGEENCKKEEDFKNYCLKNHFVKNENFFLENGIFYNADKNYLRKYEDIENIFEIQTNKLPLFIFSEKEKENELK